MKTINYTCISCPMGCALTLNDNEGELSVSGNSCPRGDRYAREEYTAPKRIITATIATDSKEIPRLPVKTAQPLPKPLVPDLLAALKEVRVSLPATMGQVVINNFANSGVDIVITRTAQLQ